MEAKIQESLLTGRVANVLVWYDNNFEFAKRMLDLGHYIITTEERRI